MPWREALSLILSYPVWYDDGPDKLLTIDALRFSLSFDSFEATVSKGKDELGQYLFRSWNLFGPFGPRNRPWGSKASFFLSELFSLIWSTRTTALKAFPIL